MMNFFNWKWDQPFWLLVLFLVPFLAIFCLKILNNRIKTMENVFGESVLKFLASTVSGRKTKLKLLLEMLGVTFFILALARPQFGEKPQSIKSQGIEMMILFDVSESMMAEDVAPSRMEFAKKQMMQLLDLVTGSKVGLVAFAGSAALVSPITTDASALKMFIDSLSIDSVSSQGTDFKKALEEAEGAFERGGQSVDPTTRVTRVILIVSDGEDQEEGAMQAASKLTEKGIRIFSVAVGTEKGGNIPLRDPNNILRGYKKNKQGKEIITTVNGEALKALAQKGKGSFYFSSMDDTYLKNLASDFDHLDKAEFDSQFITRFEERYQGFLLMGFICFMVAWSLSGRRGASPSWRGRFEVHNE